MTASTPALGDTPAKRPLRTAPARHMPGEEGIWLFVFGDMMMFSLFFIVYLYYRGQDVALFSQSQAHLNKGLGALNTFLMLSSSWCVATAVRAARRGMPRATPRLLMVGVACGLAFGGVKVVEYGEKIRAGLVLTTNDFFMYYYMFTGIHLLHVLIGTAVLVYLVQLTRKGAAFDAATVRTLETGASFWHVVDLLWIVLFALLYLAK